MKILIDDGLISRGAKSGIGHHTLSLVQSLTEVADCTLTEYPFIHRIPRYWKKWAYIGASNLSVHWRDYDVVHHLNNYVPSMRWGRKHIMTIYDLSTLRYPETISIAWRHYNQHVLRASITRADALITISEAIRNEVLESFPSVPPDRVLVSVIGTRQMLRTDEIFPMSLSELGLRPFEYFLFVGDLTKRKNLRFLLEVFLRAKEEKEISQATKLVLVGKRAWGFRDFENLIQHESGVLALGYLPDETISSLYKNCKAFVYPSLYEGFGIPLVEAMVQGAPIVASAIPTTIELNNSQGEQMRLFELGDAAMLMRHLAVLDAEWERIRQGTDYGDLSRYQYSNVARRHMEIYRAVLDRPS